MHLTKKEILCYNLLGCFRRVWLLATLWLVAHQAPLIHGILQARILEWVAMPSSRGSSQPRDWTQVSSFSCIAGVTAMQWLPSHQGSPVCYEAECDKRTNSGLKSQRRCCRSNMQGWSGRNRGYGGRRDILVKGTPGTILCIRKTMCDSGNKETFSVAGTQSEGCVWSEISLEGEGVGQVKPQRSYYAS